ncbi:hypothetical protein ACFQMF_13850 [Halorubrum rutilum]|uniref:DNA polymerase I n=1 Tax=Halorubrum rutilum TaxID=1364933 RepID=A0ABD6AN81_9EURY|nr:hypothetical protein [Halorubrum rutilum]
MPDLQECIDEYAAEVEYTAHATKFLQLDRWTGDNPLLLLADAAGTTTGQAYFSQVKPSVETFQTKFLDTGRISSFSELADLDQQSPALTEIFEAQRKRRVLITGADTFAEIDAEDDLDRLQQWAEDADPTDYSEERFGRIRGVGLRTFQYLRMIAGIDTVKPDIQVQRFIKELSETTDTPHLDASTDQAVLDSCQWISDKTDYRMIELDQIAWWYFADATGRHAAETLNE